MGLLRPLTIVINWYWYVKKIAKISHNYFFWPIQRTCWRQTCFRKKYFSIFSVKSGRNGRQRKIVCVCDREFVCVCVYSFEWYCVWERKCVHVCECLSIFVSVSVCVRERKRKKEGEKRHCQEVANWCFRN